MNWTTLYQDFFSMASPALPGATLLWLAFNGFWAIVLGGVGVRLSRRWARPYRLGLLGLLLVWTLMPGPASPDYWLGLAFQVPSLATALICLYWILDLVMPAHYRVRAWAPDPAQIHALKGLGLAGVVLGWLLLLDMLALLPFTFYAWGFSTAGLAGLAVLGSLPWVLWSTAPAARLVSFLSLLVLTLFVLTRLPDGNLWDALIDPLLWVVLQLAWLGSVLRRLMARWRASRATRA